MTTQTLPTLPTTPFPITPGLVAATAIRYLPKLRANYLAYLDECEQDRRQGHRPHYCEHGLDLWVDWDPICGSCEDGLTGWRGVRQSALDAAHRYLYALNAILTARQALAKVGLQEHFDAAAAIAELTARYGV